MLPAAVHFRGPVWQFITAALRPGTRPTGAENAAIVKRVLKRLRAVWPGTRIILRADGHFANPELMRLALDTPHTDFLVGLAGHRVLSPLAAPFQKAARHLHETRCVLARQHPQAVRNPHLP